MALVRTRRAEPTWPTDETLSWAARGLLAYLLTRPGGSEIQMDDLANAGPCSTDELRRVMTELEERGYAHREKKRQYDGTFQQVTEIREHPVGQAAPDLSLESAGQAPDRRPSGHESVPSRTVSSAPTG